MEPGSKHWGMLTQDDRDAAYNNSLKRCRAARR